MEKPQTISSERLSTLSRLPESRLRELSKAGFIPKKTGDGYPLNAAIAGLFRFYSERESAGLELPEYGSMQSCAAATKIPLQLIKQAKHAGCPAFHASGRVKLGLLLSWIFSTEANGQESVGDWGKELKKWQAKRAKIEHDREVGELVEKVAVTEQVREWNAKARAVLQRLLEVELPARCAGQDAKEILRHNKAALGEVCGILGKADQWASP